MLRIYFFNLCAFLTIFKFLVNAEIQFFQYLSTSQTIIEEIFFTILSVSFFSNIASQCVISCFFFFIHVIYLSCLFPYLITCYLYLVCFCVHCFYFLVLFIYNLCDIVFFSIVKDLSDLLYFLLGWLVICNFTWYIIR